MKLDGPARMNLMKFVCSFVWTDLKVHQAERDLVMRIAGHLALADDEVAQVKRWLQVPPPVDEIDPAMVPREHRELFLSAAELVAKADGRVVPAERDTLALFRDLLAD
ncbi:MAG: TerB family tellurite resistance protein [Planctomycetes bacterium]|nr:TerB family tellurite resistance protein [Planctomycetota bacterium]MCB9884142.1 TerB family tellurite resistance protein [Planctomycetota bacterium]